MIPFEIFVVYMYIYRYWLKRFDREASVENGERT